MKVDPVDSCIYHLARPLSTTSARLLFVQSHGAAWLANAEGDLPGAGPGDVQHCWQSAAQVLQHEGMPPGKTPGGDGKNSCAKWKKWETEEEEMGSRSLVSLGTVRCSEPLTDWVSAHLVPLFQVEETAFLLQIHEKRPPPRGPFPWAEGYLTGSASDPGLAFFLTSSSWKNEPNHWSVDPSSVNRRLDWLIQSHFSCSLML